MNIENLIKMANQIAGFFESYPNEAEASSEIANHLKKFWPPRMRQQLLQHMDATRGKGLKEIVLSSLHAHRNELESKTASPSHGINKLSR